MFRFDGENWLNLANVTWVNVVGSSSSWRINWTFESGGVQSPTVYTSKALAEQAVKDLLSGL